MARAFPYKQFSITVVLGSWQRFARAQNPWDVIDREEHWVHGYYRESKYTLFTTSWMFFEGEKYWVGGLFAYMKLKWREE